MISSLLVFQLGKRGYVRHVARWIVAGVFSHVHKDFSHSDFSTWVAGFLVGISRWVTRYRTLADLSNIGTLLVRARGWRRIDIALHSTRPPRGPFEHRWPDCSGTHDSHCLLLMAGLPLRTGFDLSFG